MAIGFVVEVAFASVCIVLASALVWQARRIGDAATIRQDLDTVDKKLENLSEIVTSYIKRDAQRVSAAVQRAKKTAPQETEVDTPEETMIRTPEDIVKVFEKRHGQ